MPVQRRDSLHSIRCNDEAWAAAKERAHSEGFPINRVLEEFLEGYAKGDLSLPR
jgi:hypothetical protein